MTSPISVRRALAGAARPLLLLLLVLSVLAASCTDDDSTIRGSGDLVTETREVAGFDTIVVEGLGEFDVEVSGSESLSVTADDNVIGVLTVEVDGDRLELAVEDEVSLSSATVRYVISASALDGVEIRGSGEVAARGIDTERFSVRISGSGEVVPIGSADELDVDIDGSGTVEGTDLEASRATVAINGSGSVVVDAADRLDVSINGSGEVRYLGDPELDQSINGSGSVNPA